ncbi:phosphatase [Agrobacterium vitis]|uniref:Phosphatase n=2 Tax=Agrobacterium vitis TaxID=373 RepID=A0A368NXB4_AGRVI|nr:phosphatase [Agrobacterium vitis]KAA3532084.1 phosphatase [Agrobacterium vitis]MCF1475857.1 phosphatase [Agrobacterium vitis]MUZ97085.1 phosphatase [Agrobacterium vitis]MVA32025.1 phosphatase [Agrobacterium vitis]
MKPTAMRTPMPKLRLGLIADPQYADLPPNLTANRYYALSLAKMQAAIDMFNEQALDAVVLLGDLIDRDFRNFAPALKVLEGLRHPLIALPGNHDFAVSDAQKPMVRDALGMPTPYFDRVINGIRLIFTDGCEISTFSVARDDPAREVAVRQLLALKAQGAANAQDWNAAISQPQIDWLESRLTLAHAAGEKAIVFGHYPLHPFTDHALWNAQQVADVIAAAPAAIAYINGHDHRGGYGLIGDTHFITLKGMVDGEDETAFAILTLETDRFGLQGFGREDDRLLPLGRHGA